MAIQDNQSDLQAAQNPPTGLPIQVADETTRLAQPGLLDGAIVDQGDVGLFYLLTDEENPSDPEAWLTLLTSAQANALVTDTTITPPQAWVSFMEQANGSGGLTGSEFDLSAEQVTHFSVDFFEAWLGVATTQGPIVANLSGGSMNLTDVDGLIRILALIGIAADAIDVSGGTHAAPTLDAGRVDGTWVITITGVPVGTIELTDADTSGTGTITFGTDVDVSSADEDTIAGLLSDYINGLTIPGWTSTYSANAVTVTVEGDDARLPLPAGTDSATNLTIADTPGNPSFIGQIEARGGSVTHN